MLIKSKHILTSDNLNKKDASKYGYLLFLAIFIAVTRNGEQENLAWAV